MTKVDMHAFVVPPAGVVAIRQFAVDQAQQLSGHNQSATMLVKAARIIEAYILEQPAEAEEHDA